MTARHVFGPCVDCGRRCRSRREPAMRRCWSCFLQAWSIQALDDMPTRFWSKVDKTDAGGCWLWTGPLESSGYGSFSLTSGEGRKVMKKAHRLAYEFVVGQIPVGLELDHLCRVLTCVNPDHLEPVTTVENQHRRRRVLCGRGHFAWVPRPNGTRVCRACERDRYRLRHGSRAA